MKKYRLAFTSGVALLCLLTDYLSSETGWAAANKTNNGTAQSELTTNVSASQTPNFAEANRLAQAQGNTALATESMAQITSVSLLRDISPTDWAYEALRSLVERYGCLVGYPDGTYRGGRALTRWEFAAGLNACMSTIERLLQEQEGILKEDVDKLERLTQEYETELAALQTRADNLESRVAFLEDHQFSPTMKLSGEAIFAITGATGGEPDSDGAQIVLNDRVRLKLTASFTGKDQLITGLQAYNFGGGLPITGNSSIEEVLFPNDSSILSEGMTKLNFEPQFPGFNPQNLEPNCGDNTVCLYKLLYIFPVVDKLSLFVGPMAETTDAFPEIVPFADEGQGALSRFAALNPVVRVSGGTSGTGLASAGGFIFTPIPEVDLRALYGSVNAAIPENRGFPDTVLGAGLFNGSYVVATQLTLKPTDTLDIGLNYAHSYHQVNILGTGLAGFSTGVLGGLPLTTAVTVDSIGATLTWRFSAKAYFTTYGAYFMVDEAGAGDAFTNLTSWMAGFYFPDAFIEGNSAGILGGQPLYRVAAGNGATRNSANIGDRATPYQVEAFYNLKLNDNISITPGAFVIFNPEEDADNDTTGIAVLRTTFTF